MRNLSDDDSKVKALDELFLQVGVYRSSVDYKALLDAIRRFHKIAPYNAMLVSIQKPGSVFVASAAQWKKDFGRRIKPDARPLVILQPFGPVSFVFELGDTDGEQFPKELEQPFKTKGKLPPYVMENLVSSLPRSGIACYEADHGTASAGSIERLAKAMWQELPAARQKGKQLVLAEPIRVIVYYAMLVNKNLDMGAKFATILHELAHIYCGHQGTPLKKWKLWPNRPGLDKGVKEFEAESVAWLVCERYGVDNPSEKYLSGYLTANNEIPNISLETVLKATNTIETMLHGCFQARKELLWTKALRVVNNFQRLPARAEVAQQP